MDVCISKSIKDGEWQEGRGWGGRKGEISTRIITDCTSLCIVLLQHGADAAIRNSDGKTALDLAEPTAKLVLTGDYKKDELLEAARTGNEEVLMALISPLNVNCHADDGRKVNVVVVHHVLFTTDGEKCGEVQYKIVYMLC